MASSSDPDAIRLAAFNRLNRLDGNLCESVCGPTELKLLKLVFESKFPVEISNPDLESRFASSDLY